MTSLPDGIEIRGEIASGFDQILTSDALALVAKLQRELGKRRIECLKRRQERQIALIRPKVLVALGATAAEALLQTKRSLTDLRGKVHSYHGIPLVVTYHPAALLRNPNWKKPTWDDIRIARQLLDR